MVECAIGPSNRSVNSAMRLRTCYPQPGTDVAHSAMSLRACYAIPGTEIAYDATRIWARGVSGKRYVPTRLIPALRY
eukprot:2678080-Rhodomonas_salina.3